MPLSTMTLSIMHKIVTLSNALLTVLFSVLMLSVFILIVIMPSETMLSRAVLSVATLSVIMLSAMAPVICQHNMTFQHSKQITNF
jgi:hypothetical protein